MKIFVPHTGQVPCVAGRPFFIVICFASLISREALHFTQYPVATGDLHARSCTRRRSAVRTHALVIAGDRAAELWCENASALTGTVWRFLKVPQKEHERLEPTDFADLAVFARS